jgi:hypothetical protein
MRGSRGRWNLAPAVDDVVHLSVTEQAGRANALCTS